MHPLVADSTILAEVPSMTVVDEGGLVDHYFSTLFARRGKK